jgi:hypothetical protein
LSHAASPAAIVSAIAMKASASLSSSVISPLPIAGEASHLGVAESIQLPRLLPKRARFHQSADSWGACRLSSAGVNDVRFMFPMRNPRKPKPARGLNSPHRHPGRSEAESRDPD